VLPDEEARSGHLSGWSDILRELGRIVPSTRRTDS
jgi:hypothetical protein